MVVEYNDEEMRLLDTNALLWDSVGANASRVDAVKRAINRTAFGMPVNCVMLESGTMSFWVCLFCS